MSIYSRLLSRNADRSDKSLYRNLCILSSWEWHDVTFGKTPSLTKKTTNTIWEAAVLEPWRRPPESLGASSDSSSLLPLDLQPPELCALRSALDPSRSEVEKRDEEPLGASPEHKFCPFRRCSGLLPKRLLVNTIK
jgi:hypothetical protein